VFEGGVWFCDLTEARSLDGVAAAVANALEVALAKGDPMVQLDHAIAGRGHALLILDNFEQVVKHAEATVGRWLERAPEARFVVTSREHLGLVGEEVQAIEPFDEEEGVALFLARARAYRPDFGSKRAEEEGVRQVVRLVDGLPLAIELAAARLRILGIGQIVERLGNRFQLLAGGKTEGRHATLRAAIDSSWELLKPWEKAAFAQCAVFEGGFTLAAAEEVLDLGPWPQAGVGSAVWVVDVVQALVDKSLVRMWVPEGLGGEPRFTMYVSLQDYARARLREGGSGAPEAASAVAEGSAEGRHRRYFARFGTDQAIDALDLPGGIERRRHLGAELDNLVAACRRAVAGGDGDTAVNAFAAAWEVLDLRGPFAVGTALGQAVLAMAGLAPAARARASYLSAIAHGRAGRMEEAREHLERALAIYREVGHRESEGVALGKFGTRSVPTRRHRSPTPAASPRCVRSGRGGPDARFGTGRQTHRGEALGGQARAHPRVSGGGQGAVLTR
jgi:predicted ATPase